MMSVDAVVHSERREKEFADFVDSLFCHRYADPLVEVYILIGEEIAGLLPDIVNGLCQCGIFEFQGYPYVFLGLRDCIYPHGKDNHKTEQPAYSCRTLCFFIHIFAKLLVISVIIISACYGLRIRYICRLFYAGADSVRMWFYVMAFWF